MPFQLTIISPERTVFDGSVDFVAVRGVEGELGILPGHIPLFTQLQTDLLTFDQAGKKEIAAVMGGFLDVQPDHVTVLADAAELASEIDVMRAKEAKERAEAHAAKVKDVEATVLLERAIVRLKAVEALGKLPAQLR